MVDKSAKFAVKSSFVSLYVGWLETSCEKTFKKIEKKVLTFEKGCGIITKRSRESTEKTAKRKADKA